ncbi:MAG: DUF5009 domain-containing protein [Bacteroidales bacterium]|nr:DUF5009 domain-containing protein [Candidatus Cacconaster merdequi]
MADNNKRLLSLDALRGFDMFFIMGLASFICAVCGLFPEGGDCALARNMSHVQWDGLRHHDTIFPLFLFIAGISFPFSYAKQISSGTSRGRIYCKIFRRGIVLVLLGLVYNGLFNLDFENLRVASVLGRIGLAWMFAALLFINFNKVTRAVIAAVILIGYYLVIRFIPAPDVYGGDPLSIDANFAGYFDRLFLPGRLLYNHGNFDPEGLFSTLPAIVTAMLGMFTGEFVRSEKKGLTGGRKSLYLALSGLVMLGIGLLWSLDFPINKKLWSSSFVLVVGAYSVLMFALFYYIIDVKGHTKWTLPFKVVGMNSITIYLAQRIIGFRKISDFFFSGVAQMCPEEWARLIDSTGYLLVSWLFLYFLYRKKIFLKV